ncbi:ORF953 [White spot syndrome virus]|uniref:ORF953 n=1 Tax=White spot syndrome virus TaxID=342409 RepID=A0A2D3I632_9VIRU|nr:ORF953 [White spot syndrome virus]
MGLTQLIQSISPHHIGYERFQSFDALCNPILSFLSRRRNRVSQPLNARAQSCVGVDSRTVKFRCSDLEHVTTSMTSIGKH